MDNLGQKTSIYLYLWLSVAECMRLTEDFKNSVALRKKRRTAEEGGW